MKSRLFNFYPLKNLTESIDSDIERYGVNKTMAGLIKKCGTELKIVNKTQELNVVLKSKPVVIVANHPAQADVLAILAALPYRHDLKMVSIAYLLKICKKFDKHLIPVYIFNRLVSNGERGNLEILKKISNLPQYTYEEERRKNVESIKVAGRTLKKGGLVVIFPAGGSKNNKWLNGIGYMIKNSEKKTGVCVVKAFIEGTSRWDYFRIIPFIGRLMPKFKVTFSEARDVSVYLSENPKTTTTNIEADFNSWSDQFNRVNTWLPYKTLAVIRSVFFWIMMKGH